eukprot:Skav221968  [mRNA]  locus=scaffold195:885836:886768:- [translate_table: standard]
MTMPTLLTAKPSVGRGSCAAEGWLDEKFGEDKGQSQDYTFFGVDFKPILPVALAICTVARAICMFLVQIPMLSPFSSLSQEALFSGFAVIYLVTLILMGYYSFVNPEQEDQHGGAGADLEAGVPRRHPIGSLGRMGADWHWPVEPPAVRLDGRRFGCNSRTRHLGGHSTRRHRREGLASGLMSGTILAMHLVYSVALLAVAGPVLKMHFGLISGNEMALKRENEHYIANNSNVGDNISVENLEDEIKTLFRQDAPGYRSRNPLDCRMNCCNFWCQPAPATAAQVRQVKAFARSVLRLAWGMPVSNLLEPD